MDRNIVDHSTIRLLVEDYFLPVINAECPVIDPSQLLLDTQIRRLQVSRRLFVCMAAAIAAAHQGRYHPEMHAVARFMRQWAGELTDAVFLNQTGDTVQALLLLIMYELVDPSSKIVWYLLSLACRMCVRLSWHRTLFVEEPAWVAAGHENKTEYSYSTIRRLFYVLYQWQRSVASVLGRPPLLPAQLVEPLPTLIGNLPLDPSFQAAYLESKLGQLLQRSEGNNSCVITPALLQFISANLHKSPTHNKLWLMLHNVVRHRCRDCTHQAQWLSDTAAIIEEAAVSIIEKEHENHRETQTLSIWLTAPLVFAAGNILIESALYKRAEAEDQMVSLRPLLRCSNLLTAYAGAYPEARAYREIFATFLDHLV
jgi:Fungal specific transcription factor domain